MSAPIFDLISLFTAQTAKQIFDAVMSFAETAGLPVTTWRIGDPTRTQFEFEATHLSQVDAIAAELAKGAYLDTAEGEWLDAKTEQDFGVTRDAATYAEGTITLANNSAAIYNWDANDLTFKNPLTGKTYKNSGAVSLTGVGSTQTFNYIAEEPGSESSTGANTLELLTTIIGVSVTGNTAAIGIDAQSDPSLRAAARLSLAALSPAGPSDAFNYVALNSALTGSTAVQKAVTDGDTTTGIVTVYVSGINAEIETADLALVETALRSYALGVCQTLVLESAIQVPATIQLSVLLRPGYLSESDVQGLVEVELAALFAALKIGQGVSLSAIIGAVYDALPRGSFVSAAVTSPASDISADPDENLYFNSVTVIATTEV